LPDAHKYGIVLSVKTTLEIPDDLFRRAKAQAASRGIPLRQFVTEAVEQRVHGGAHPTGAAAWKQLSGDLGTLRRETARVSKLIESEFEQLDPEDDG
jgi:hypothetical protein